MKSRWTLPGLMMIAAGAVAQGAASGPTYVFFDWSKGELSSDSTATLDGLVERYRAAPQPMLIDGHSDRSGPAGPNLAASRRRAEMAREYLVAHGIPRSAMRVRAYGEAAPIIATADGVREVQNRRVEIRWGDAAN